MTTETVTTAAEGPLSGDEEQRLTRLEGVINRGLSAFVEVGQALTEIRDSRLYRQTYATFEAYCQERWGWSRQHANRQIAAAEVWGLLEPMGSTVANERQARELAPLRADPDVLQEITRRVVEQSGTDFTATDVKRVTEAALHEAVMDAAGEIFSERLQRLVKKSTQRVQIAVEETRRPVMDPGQPRRVEVEVVNSAPVSAVTRTSRFAIDHVEAGETEATAAIKAGVFTTSFPDAVHHLDKWAWFFEDQPEGFLVKANDWHASNRARILNEIRHLIAALTTWEALLAEREEFSP